MKQACTRTLTALGLGIAVVHGVALEPIARAQSTEQATPVERAPSDAHPLGGPRVESRPVARTLVRRAMGGGLEELDLRPEAAAVELLDLSERERADVQRVLEARAAHVSQILAEHYELFLRAQGLRQAMQEGGDRREAAGILRELREATQPLMTPALRAQVAEVLNPASRAEFDRLVDEYVAALASQPRDRDAQRPVQRAGPRTPTPDAEAPSTPLDVLARRRVEQVLVQREVGRALLGTIAMRQEQMGSFLKAVSATPEQEASIRAIVLGASSNSDAVRTTLRTPSEQQRAELLPRILAELTPEQRRAALQYIRGQ